VSAVTFVAATTWLESRGLEFSGSIIAVMAIMEVPAIIIGIFMAQRSASQEQKTANDFSLKKLLHEAIFNGSVFLLLGSLIIGWSSGTKGAESLGAFTFDIFKGLV
jgi:hypothetical protein